MSEQLLYRLPPICISESINDNIYQPFIKPFDSYLSFLPITHFCFTVCLFFCHTDINSSHWPSRVLLFTDSCRRTSSRWCPVRDDICYQGRQPCSQRHGLLSGPQLPLRNVRETGKCWMMHAFKSVLPKQVPRWRNECFSSRFCVWMQVFKCQEKLVNAWVLQQGPRQLTSAHHQIHQLLLAINNLGGTAGDALTAFDNEGEQWGQGQRKK